MKIRQTLLSMAALLTGINANAQLSTNPDKFLGNITTSYQVDYGSEKYYTLWNQITCENESKWGSIEGTNNSFNWSGSDNAYNYAKNHGFPFKFHALVWGSQYPSWLEKQTPEQRYKEIVQWMDQVKKHYPNLQLIDVVNEAITGHQAGTPYFIEALGGTGKTGYDWVIKAFELAYERWPDAILIYNDFNTFQWNTDQYIELVKALRDAGAPIDAYGCQSHDLTDCSLTTFKNSMTKIQNALKMPMYSTEYDIGTDDDNLQLQRYKEQIPYMWESDYVAGVTLWGYIYGRTWTTDGNSGIIKSGTDRPAMTWLREYMKTDAAKNAKSPFPGMVKEASVYVQPSELTVEKDKEMSITVRARMKTKTIQKVALYAKNQLVTTMTEAPYIAAYTPSATGTQELKAIVTCTDGTTYTRYSQITVANARAPFNNTPASLPGTIEAENFDMGIDGDAFHDTNKQQEGSASSYRTDITGIDIENGGTGKVVGYGQVGEWMEYTVDVKEAGYYAYTISYSSPNGAAVSLSLRTPEGQQLLTDEQLALIKSSNWTTFRTYTGRLLLPLEAGKNILRLSITGGEDTYVANIDKIKFEHVNINEDMAIRFYSDPEVATLGNKVTLKVDATSPSTIKNVKLYNGGLLMKTFTAAPYEYTIPTNIKTTYHFSAIATDADGKQSEVAYLTLPVKVLRAPFKANDLPGIIEAENFDMGEEGDAYHDSDLVDEGKSGYRTDNGGVDIKKLSSGAYVISNTVVGEWMEYTVNVTQAGKYTCSVVASAEEKGYPFRIYEITETGAQSPMWSFNVTTAGVSTYKTYTSSLTRELTAGKHVFYLYIAKAGCNIDKFEFTCVEPTPVDIVSEEQTPLYNHIYNISGQRVDENYKGIVIINGKKFLKK